ncbi:MAG: sugar ABC transporter permease [Opitutales bacterium]|jgi:ABC-type sugar transport system permease subunit
MNRTRKAISPWVPYLFVAPFLLTFAVFTVYPLFQSVVLTTQQTFGPGYEHYVGAANFRNMVHDVRFWVALRNTVIFAVISVALLMPMSLGLAVLMNQPWLKGRSLFRLAIFSPALVGSVFVGVMSAIVFQKRTGMLNQILHSLFNFDPDFPWLSIYLMPAMIIATLWMWTGYNMIYFLAALQSVDKELTDAASIDGAGRWQRFRHITIPAIRPVAGFVMLISMLASLQVFELPYLMLSRQSAGPEDRGLTVVMYLYQTGFNIGDLGYASAIGWALALILISISVIYRRLSRNEAT